MDDKSKLFMHFCGILAAVFFVLTAWSMMTGSTVMSENIPESKFEKEAFAEPHGRFTMESGGIVQMNVNATTLNNSWVWLKTIIIDRNNNAVLENKFELSYYSGSGWSEGDKDESWTFYLPKGDYKVIVYGEDAKNRSGWTTPRKEMVQVSISQGAVLTRYFLVGLIVFGGLFVLMAAKASNKNDEFGAFA